MKNWLPKRERKILFSLIVIITAIILIFLVCAVKARGAVREDFTEVTHTVRYGETPWSIAEQYCPGSVDKRLYLQWCAEENGRSGWNTYIYPGEVLIFLELEETKK